MCIPIRNVRSLTVVHTSFGSIKGAVNQNMVRQTSNIYTCQAEKSKDHTVVWRKLWTLSIVSTLVCSRKTSEIDYNIEEYGIDEVFEVEPIILGIKILYSRRKVSKDQSSLEKINITLSFVSMKTSGVHIRAQKIH